MNIKKIYGLALTNKTIYRYMRLNNIQSITRKKVQRYNKVSHHNIPNVLQRNFTTTSPNEKWSIDVSYIFSREGKQYLCAIKDLYDKCIVSNTVSRFNDNKLVLDTVKEALNSVPDHQRKNLIIHSDQGYQFTSIQYKELLKRNNIIHSVSFKGSCVDNVPIESWFSALKSESLYIYKPETNLEARLIIEKYVYYYNNERLQEQLKELTPLEYRSLALSTFI